MQNEMYKFVSRAKNVPTVYLQIRKCTNGTDKIAIRLSGHVSLMNLDAWLPGFCAI